MPAVTWSPVASDGPARTGTLVTPHGSVRTPAFMPVGTRAAVKSVGIPALAGAGAEIVLANTYHLMLRPGSDVIAEVGGLHGFMAWDGPILTDSGGFQIFSLNPVIDDEAALFRSVYDGSSVHLTPERAVLVQEELGADIAMALDVCVGLPAPRHLVGLEMRRTIRWAERCLTAHTKSDQALFGIVQGGVDLDLRVESARETAGLGFDGFGIGGLSVGETAEERASVLDVVIPELPGSLPRYVMGLGDTEGLLDAIGRGADIFDCVIPTRLARHGRALTADGDFNLRRKEFERDQSPLEEGCPCDTCTLHTRAYIRHLVRVGEISAHTLLTVHNLAYTLRLVSGAADAIAEGRYAGYVDQVIARRRDSAYQRPDA